MEILSLALSQKTVSVCKVTKKDSERVNLRMRQLELLLRKFGKMLFSDALCFKSKKIKKKSVLKADFSLCLYDF